MTRYFSVRNFDKFQHYRDRSPPWIKLYTSLLDDFEFGQLATNEKWHLIGIWILASRLKNRIPWDANWIAGKIQTDAFINLDILEDGGWITCEAQEEPDKWSSRYVSTELRGRLLKAANGRCRACGKKQNLEIDHIVPISQGGTSEENNLQVLCRSCNRKKRLSSTSYVAAESTSEVSVALARSRETETETETEDKLHCNVAASQHDDVSPKKKNGLTEDAQAVLEFLNLLTNKNYRLKNPNGKLTANGEIIIARLKDGYETEVLTQVIAERNQEWAGTDMAKYLRPVTLFNKTKFAQYVGSVE